ncbi:MAG: oligosaccharide flippase family protein [Acidobacteriaceae bacterium]|nr:oligosaccharide flippase family protein [Acidobacteriaceae bacterium]
MTGLSSDAVVTPDLSVATESSYSTQSIVQRLARSFAAYGVANFGIRALNFIFLLVYSHFLHPSDFGTIYMSEIIAAFLVIFAGLSIDSALQRLYFQHYHNRAELQSYLGSTIRFGFLWMAVFLALTFVFGDRIAASRVAVPFYPYIAMASVTAFATQGIQLRLAIYQASGRPQLYAVLSCALALFTAVSCLYSVAVRHGGAVGMLQAKLVAALLVFLAAVWTMRSLLSSQFHWKYVCESLRFALPLIPHMVMASGLVVADRFILQHYRDLSEVGIYSLAYTCGMVMYLVTQSLSQAWLPMFFDLAGRGERRTLGDICSGLMVFLAVLACLGILLSPLFVTIVLDWRYHAAARIVPLVVIGYLFHALFSLFDLSILHAKRTSMVFYISLIAFTVNIALNLSAVPRWGMYGAAWATTCAYAVEALGAFFLTQRFFALPYRASEVLIALAVTGGALGLTQLGWIHGWLLFLCALLSVASLVFVGRYHVGGVFGLVWKTHDTLSTLQEGEH